MAGARRAIGHIERRATHRRDAPPEQCIAYAGQDTRLWPDTRVSRSFATVGDNELAHHAVCARQAPAGACARCRRVRHLIAADHAVRRRSVHHRGNHGRSASCGSVTICAMSRPRRWQQPPVSSAPPDSAFVAARNGDRSSTHRVVVGNTIAVVVKRASSAISGSRLPRRSASRSRRWPRRHDLAAAVGTLVRRAWRGVFPLRPLCRREGFCGLIVSSPPCIEQPMSTRWPAPVRSRPAAPR